MVAGIKQYTNETAQISDCDIEIILSTTKKDKIGIFTISELLLFAFGPKDLGAKTKKE